MIVIQRHFERCRRDHPLRCATIGVGFYGTLALAVLCHAAISAVWP